MLLYLTKTCWGEFRSLGEVPQGAWIIKLWPRAPRTALSLLKEARNPKSSFHNFIKLK